MLSSSSVHFAMVISFKLEPTHIVSKFFFDTGFIPYVSVIILKVEGQF